MTATTTAHFPLKLLLGLIGAIVLDTATQLLWKSAVIAVPDMPDLWQTAWVMLQQPLFLGVILLMGGQFLNWIIVLDHADLSYAHAITSLSYISVCGLSVWLLGERLDVWQGLGIVLILVGVFFISRSGHVTVGEIEP